MFRIACRFEPAHTRLNGSRRGRRHRLAPKGAWRVMNCIEMPQQSPVGAITTWNGKVWLPSTRKIQPGALCDPFATLKRWLANRREVNAV